MRTYFGYTRVSTAKQGELGVSLQEQQDAIAAYAQRHGLEIMRWFEERETAAKRGRPLFADMLRLLRQGQATGAIIHKIDRSARNLRDWADLGELIDAGVEVHFANESLDLHSRGGRLSADIQAVIAADYVRNLRDEIKKGFYGRLKQGILPLPAPLGYLNCGAGKPKQPDPASAPLVKRAFELYATGQFTLDTLRAELTRQGLRNRRGGPISVNGVSCVLNNPFYIGLIRLRRSGETFPGAHPPLISTALFDRVQRTLTGRVPPRGQKHDFLFRRLLTCKVCGYRLIGETRKGWVYYRCHSKSCAGTCLREERIDAVVRARLEPLRFTDDQRQYFRDQLDAMRDGWVHEREQQRQTLALHLDGLNSRMLRLTDAYLDQVLDKTLFEQHKTALLTERRRIEEQLEGDNDRQLPDRVAEFLELAGSASLLYETALPPERRDLLQVVTSDRLVEGKNVDVTLAPPFGQLVQTLENTYGGAYRGRPRTFEHKIYTLLEHLMKNAATLPRLRRDSHDTPDGEQDQAAERAA